MKNMILSLVISTSLSAPVFAQGLEAESAALSELRGAVTGGAAEAAIPGAPEKVKPGLQHFPGAQQPGAAITEFRSGEFRFSTDARKSMKQAVAGLKAKGIAVIEAEESFGAYVITFVAPRPARVLSFDSREYAFGTDAEKTMGKIAEALEATGAVVLERNMKSLRSFRLQYIETSQSAFGGRRVLEFQSAEFPFSFDAKKSMDKAVSGLTATGCTVIEAEESFGRYALTFVAARPMTLREYVSREYQFPAEAKRALRDAADALGSMGAVVVEQMVKDGNKFSIKYFEMRQDHTFPHF